VKDLNPLAVLVVLTAAVLAVLGKVDGTDVLTLMTGLAIPAKIAGYQEQP
jgi:adenosine/AMP kinase